MKTKTMKLKIRGALKIWTSALILGTFLSVQILPASFAQEVTLAPQTLAPGKSVSSAPPPAETPVVAQSSIAALRNADKPLSLTPNQGKKNPQPEVRGLDEYSFDEALDQLQPDVASAVIVKKISAADLRKLLDLKIEVGIAVVRGKIVLFTSGENNQIRMLPAARELLRNSSVIAHTHPGGAMPSAEDFLQAGEQTEYVISNKGIYAYNHNGLIYSKPLSFGYLVGKLNAARKPKASTKDTRDALNEFIASMNEYNSLPEQAVIFRSADPSTVFPGLPILTTSTISSSSSAYVTVDQYSTSYFRINQTTNASGDRVTASINFAATASGPQNLSSFTKFIFQIRAQNDCLNSANLPCARIEFVDSNNRVAAIDLRESLRTFYQQLDITKAQLLAVNSSLDFTRIERINFVYSRDGMGGMGYIEVQTGGLRPGPLRSSEGYPIVSGMAYNDAALTNLPGNPTLNSIAMNGGTASHTQTSSESYRFTYQVSDADDLAVNQINFQNPQNLGSSLTLALWGPTARQLKVQVRDHMGRFANFYLNLTSNLQNFTLALSGADMPVGFDVTKITRIEFVADKAHMGSQYNSLTNVYVWTKGLTFVIYGSAYSPSTIFALPGSPVLKSSMTGSGTISQTQTDSRHFNFTYNLPNSTDTVVSEISWGQFVSGIFQGVPGPCGGSPSQSLVFAANGPAGKKLKFQLVDANGKISESLLNLTGSLQNYTISTSTSALPIGFDINKLAAIRFIVDSSNMGTSGTVAIETAGLGTPIIPPSTTLSPNNIVHLPLNGVVQGSTVFPAVTYIAPTGATATGTIGDRGNYFYYETKTAGWAGSGLTYDNFSTPAIETGDISGLSQLTFGIVRGNPTIGFATRVKFEIVDNLDRKAHVYLDGIGDVEKAWAISTSYFKNAGVDLTKVRVMYFIVEGQNLIGALQINQYSSGSSLPGFGLTPANITILPGDPQKNHVAPAGADSSGAGTPRGMFLNYTTGTPGWAGGGFSYDNFSTSTIETGDISQYQNLRFGLRGDPSQVKFEVLDAFGHKTSIYLHGIRSDVEQVWSISTQSIASYGVDLTKIRWIYFIVEGKNLTGSVEINKVPAIAPSGAAITPLPATPSVVRIAPDGVTANVSTISRGARLDYNTLTPGWAGVGFSFNDPATPTTESVNLSSFSYLGFGLKGDPPQVKCELVDSSGHKAFVILTGISSTSEQRWSIPTSMFFGNGIDLTHITGINFIVEGANQSGSLEIYRI